MKMKPRVYILLVCLILLISGSHSPASEARDLSGGCDTAIHFLWKGRIAADNENYQNP